MRTLIAPCSMILMLAGCATKSAQVPAVTIPSPAAPAPLREYTDLEPGWRLQIMAPVTKSGAYLIDILPSHGSTGQPKDNSIALKVSDDLIGYETAYWAVVARPGGGMSLRLTSAELTKDGQPAPIESPTRAVIHVPTYARYFRIFYLTRRSDADHNMALAGVGRMAALEPFSRVLRESPGDACSNQPRDRIYCEWIPPGMALRPQAQKTENGVTRWVDRF